MFEAQGDHAKGQGLHAGNSLVASTPSHMTPASAGTSASGRRLRARSRSKEPRRVL